MPPEGFEIPEKPYNSFLGVVTGDEIIELAEKSNKRFVTTSMSFHAGATAKISGRNVASSILQGSGDREIFIGNGNASLSSYSKDPRVLQYKNSIIPQKNNQARQRYTETGEIFQGGVSTGASVLLGQYSHIKLSIGESSDGRSTTIISTANITRRGYQGAGMNELDIYYSTDNPEVAKEANQIYNFITGKSSSYPSGADGSGLRHFIFSSPTHPALPDVLSHIKSAKEEIYIATPNLSDPKVVQALKQAAKSGVKVNIGVSENELVVKEFNPVHPGVGVAAAVSGAIRFGLETRKGQTFGATTRRSIFSAIGAGALAELAQFIYLNLTPNREKSLNAARSIAESSENANLFLFNRRFDSSTSFLETGHANFITADKNALLGTTRFTAPTLAGGTAELLVKINNDSKTVESLKSYFHQYYKEKTTKETKVIYSTFSNQLLKFMPLKSGNERIRYVVDPSMLTETKEWALLNLRKKAIYSLDQKTYWNGFSGLLRKPYHESLDDFLRDFEKGPGFMENMARQLQAFYGMQFSSPLPSSVQQATRAFDLGIQYRTIGQSDWWSAFGYATAAFGAGYLRQFAYGKYDNFSISTSERLVSDVAPKNQSLIHRWFPDVSRHTERFQGLETRNATFRAVRHLGSHPVGSGLLAGAITGLTFKTLEVGFSGDIYVQSGNRGPLATAIQRIAKQIDRSQEDYYGIAPMHSKPGMFENTAMFAINTAESLATNIFGYYAFSRPFMVLSSSWWKNIDESLKMRQERTMGAATQTWIDRALTPERAQKGLEISAGIDRFLRHAYAKFLEDIGRPVVQFFGGESWTNLIDKTVKDLYQNEQKFREVRVNFIQAVDDKLAASPYTRFLSNEGLGAYFNAFNPGKLFEFGHRAYLAGRGLREDFRVMSQFTEQIAEVQRQYSIWTDQSAGVPEKQAAYNRLNQIVSEGTLDNYFEGETREALQRDRARLNALQSERAVVLRNLRILSTSTEAHSGRLEELNAEIDSLTRKLNNKSREVWSKINQRPAFYQFNYHVDALLTDFRATYAQATGFVPGTNTRVLNTNRLFSRSALGAAGVVLFADAVAGYVAAAPRATVMQQYAAAKEINNFSKNLSNNNHGDLLMFYTPGAGRYDQAFQDMTAFSLSEYASSKILGNIGIGLGVGAIAGASGVVRAARNATPNEISRTGRNRAALGFAAGFLAAKGIAGAVGLGLAALTYFTTERIMASVLNISNMYSQQTFENKMAGAGAFSISQFSAVGQQITETIRNKDMGRLQASSEALDHMGLASQATQLAMMSILGPTENQLSNSGRQSYGKAIQISFNPMLFTLTYAENRLGSETSLSASFQAPALFELGLNFQAPFKFVSKTYAEHLLDRSKGLTPGQDTLFSRFVAASVGGLTGIAIGGGLSLIAKSRGFPIRATGRAGVAGAIVGGLAGMAGIRDYLGFMPWATPIASWMLNESNLKFDPNSSSANWLYGAIAGFGLSTIHEAIGAGTSRLIGTGEVGQSIRRNFSGIRSVYNVVGSALNIYNRFMTLVPRTLIVAPFESLANKLIDTTVSRVLQRNYGLNSTDIDKVLYDVGQDQRYLGGFRFSAILEEINKKGANITENTQSWFERWRYGAPQGSGNVLRWWEKLLFGMERFGSRPADEARVYLRTPDTAADNAAARGLQGGQQVLRTAAQRYQSSGIGRMYRGIRGSFAVMATGIVATSLYQGLSAQLKGGDEIYRIQKEQMADKERIARGEGFYGTTIGSVWGTFKNILYGFMGVGKKTHPLEGTFVNVIDRVPFDNKGYRDTEEGATNAVVRLFRNLWGGPSSNIYFGEGSRFLGTGVYGSVMGEEGDVTTWTKSYYQPSILPGVNFAYSSGTVSLKDRTNFNEYVNQLNFQTGSTKKAVQWISNRTRMRKKSLTIGKLFHDKSAVSQLGSAGQAEMYRRFELTRWISKDNVGLDFAIYFQLSHAYQNKRIQAIKRGENINPFEDMFSPNFVKDPTVYSGSAVYFKSENKLSVTQSIYEALVGSREAADEAGTLSEFDTEQVIGGLVNKSSGWNAPTGVNAHFEYMQNAWGWSASGLFGMLLTTVGVGVGAALTINAWRRNVSALTPSEKFHHLMVNAPREGFGSTGEGRIMIMYGVDASKRGRLRFRGGQDSNFFGVSNAGRWQDPSNRYWLIGIGQVSGEGGNFYYYGKQGDLRNITNNAIDSTRSGAILGGRSAGSRSMQINLSGLQAFYLESSKLIYADHQDLTHKLRGGVTSADRAFKLMEAVKTVTDGQQNVIQALDMQLAEFTRSRDLRKNAVEALSNLISQGRATPDITSAFETENANLLHTEERITEFTELRREFDKFQADSEFDKTMQETKNRLTSIWDEVRNDTSLRNITQRHAEFSRRVEEAGIFTTVANLFDEGNSNPLESGQRTQFISLIRDIHSGDYFSRKGNRPGRITYQTFEEAAGLHKMEARFITEAQGGFTAVLSGEADNWLINFGKNFRDGTLKKEIFNHWHAQYRFNAINSLFTNALRNTGVDTTSIAGMVRNIFDDIHGLAAAGDAAGAGQRFGEQDQAKIREFLQSSALSDTEAEQVIKELGEHFGAIANRDLNLTLGTSARIFAYGAVLPFFGASLNLGAKAIGMSANMFSARGYFDVAFGLSNAGDSKRSEVDRVYAARMAIADLPMLGESIMMNSAFSAGFVVERMFSSWNTSRTLNIASGVTGRAARISEARGFLRGLVFDTSAERNVVTHLTARAASLNILEANAAATAAGTSLKATGASTAAIEAAENAARTAFVGSSAIERGFITQAEGQAARVTQAGMRQYAGIMATEFQAGIAARSFEGIGRSANAVRQLAAASPAVRMGLTGGIPALVSGGLVAATGGSPEAAIMTGLAIGSLGAMLFSPVGIAGTIAIGVGYALAFKWLENPLESFITSAFKGKETDLLNYLDNNSWARTTLNAVSTVATTTQTVLDETFGKAARWKDRPNASGLTIAASYLASAPYWLFSPLSKDSNSSVFYDPEYAMNMSLSSDPGAWRLPGKAGSAFDVASMTPLWHGEMRDVINKKLNDQERIRTGDPNLLLQEWFHPSHFGQTDSLGSSIMRSSLDPHRNSSVWSNFGNLSTFGEASQHILRDRAIASQFQLTRLLERWDLWNDWSRSYGARESGYASNFGRIFKTSARSYKVSPGYNQIYLAERRDRRVSRGYAELITPGVNALSPAVNYNRTPGSINSAYGAQEQRDREGLIGTLGLLGITGLGYLAHRWWTGRGGGGSGPSGPSGPSAPSNAPISPVSPTNPGAPPPPSPGSGTAPKPGGMGAPTSGTSAGRSGTTTPAPGPSSTSSGSPGSGPGRVDRVKDWFKGLGGRFTQRFSKFTSWVSSFTGRVAQGFGKALGLLKSGTNSLVIALGSGTRALGKGIGTGFSNTVESFNNVKKFSFLTETLNMSKTMPVIGAIGSTVTMSLDAFALSTAKTKEGFNQALGSAAINVTSIGLSAGSFLAATPPVAIGLGVAAASVAIGSFFVPEKTRESFGSILNSKAQSIKDKSSEILNTLYSKASTVKKVLADVYKNAALRKSYVQQLKELAADIYKNPKDTFTYYAGPKTRIITFTTNDINSREGINLDKKLVSNFYMYKGVSDIKYQLKELKEKDKNIKNQNIVLSVLSHGGKTGLTSFYYSEKENTIYFSKFEPKFLVEQINSVGFNSSNLTMVSDACNIVTAFSSSNYNKDNVRNGVKEKGVLGNKNYQVKVSSENFEVYSFESAFSKTGAFSVEFFSDTFADFVSFEKLSKAKLNKTYSVVKKYSTTKPNFSIYGTNNATSRLSASKSSFTPILGLSLMQFITGKNVGGPTTELVNVKDFPSMPPIPHVSEKIKNKEYEKLAANAYIDYKTEGFKNELNLLLSAKEEENQKIKKGAFKKNFFEFFGIEVFPTYEDSDFIKSSKFVQEAYKREDHKEYKNTLAKFKDKGKIVENFKNYAVSVKNFTKQLIDKSKEYILNVYNFFRSEEKEQKKTKTTKSVNSLSFFSATNQVANTVLDFLMPPAYATETKNPASKAARHIAIFGQNIGGKFEGNPYVDNYLQEVLGTKNTLVHKAESLQEIPAFLKAVKEERKKLKNPKEKTVIVFSGHGSKDFGLGIFRGTNFKGSKVRPGTTSVVQEFASYGWLLRQLEKSDIKAEEVEILMNTCNSATGIYRTRAGFTPEQISNLRRSASGDKRSYEKQTRSNINVEVEIFDDKPLNSENYKILGSQGLVYGLRLLTQYLTGSTEGSLKYPDDDLVNISNIKSLPRFSVIKYAHVLSNVHNESFRLKKEAEVANVRKSLNVYSQAVSRGTTPLAMSSINFSSEFNEPISSNTVKPSSGVLSKTQAVEFSDFTQNRALELVLQRAELDCADLVSKIAYDFSKEKKIPNPLGKEGNSWKTFTPTDKGGLPNVFSITYFNALINADNLGKIFTKPINDANNNKIAGFDPKTGEIDFADLRPGDIFLYDWDKDGNINHAVTYLGITRKIIVGKADKITYMFAQGSYNNLGDKSKPVEWKNLDISAASIYGVSEGDFKFDRLIRTGKNKLWGIRRFKNIPDKHLNKTSQQSSLTSQVANAVLDFLMPPAEASVINRSYKMAIPAGEAAYKQSRAQSVVEQIAVGLEGIGAAAYVSGAYFGAKSLTNYTTARNRSVFKAQLPLNVDIPSSAKSLMKGGVGVAITANLMFNAYSFASAKTKQGQETALWEGTKDLISLGAGVAASGITAVGATAVAGALSPVIGTAAAGVAAFSLATAAGIGIAAGVYTGLDKLNQVFDNKIKSNIYSKSKTALEAISNFLMPPAEAAETSVYRPGAGYTSYDKASQMTDRTASAFGLAQFVGWFNKAWSFAKQVLEKGLNTLSGYSPFGPKGNSLKAQSGITTEGLVGGMAQHVLDFQAAFPGSVMSSGYRDKARNEGANGVPGSYHTRGMAFDIVGIPGEGTATAVQIHKWAAARSLSAYWHDAGSGYHWHIRPITGQEGKATAYPHPDHEHHPHPAGGGGGGGKPAKQVSKNLVLMSSANSIARLPMALAASKANHGITQTMLDNLNKYDPAIQKASARFGVPVNLVRAVILTESGGVNHEKENFAGAVGTMQVVSHYHAGLAKKLTGSADLSNVDVNITTGTALLAGFLRNNNNQVLHAVAAYNAGQGAVNRKGTVPNYTETQKYIASIAAYYHGLSKLSNTKERLDTALLDAYVAEQKANNESRFTQERFKVQYSANVSAESDSHTHDRHCYEVENRSEVELYQDPATKRQIARATYPDNTKWTSLWDRHFSPIENSGLDNHFRRG